MQALYSEIVIHALFWLMSGCFVGVLLSVLLIFPELTVIYDHITYGKIVPLHLNIQLYGWCSIPLIGVLFKIFGTSERYQKINHLAVYVWSCSILLGCLSWLMGNSSGKIFLEWTGFSRYFFISNLLYLWGCLFLNAKTVESTKRKSVKILKAVILVSLLCIPFIMYFATDPRLFPPINVSSSGATGSSLVISSLSVIFICIALPPFMLKQRVPLFQLCLTLITSISSLCIWSQMNHGNSTHYDLDQRRGMGSLLIWIPVLVLYYFSFTWDKKYAAWLKSLCFWGIVLVSTAVCMFDPTILDIYKFTSGIVAHVHVAMAGFLSSLLFIVILYLLGNQKISEVISSPKMCLFWNLGLIMHVISLICIAKEETLHFGAGYLSPGYLNFQYLRLGSGILMLLVVIYYTYNALRLRRNALL